MKQCLINIVIATAFLVVMQPISAQEPVKTLEAHVHGISELMIVAEGDTLEIQFKSPAMNLVGFEHRARTSHDITTVEKAAATLRQHDALFLMSDANCKQTNTLVDLSKIIDTDHHDNDDENSSNDGKHAHHNEAHETHEEHDGSHSEIIATYNYYCKERTSLPSITVKLFEFFTGIEEINTLWVNQTGQGAITLSPSYRTINF